MTLAISSIEPDSGPAFGGNLVKLSGQGLKRDVRVFFGGLAAANQDIESSACYVTTPKHPVGWASVEVVQDDERCTLPDAYRYNRSSLTEENDLTRLVRVLLQQLKAHVLEQTSVTVDVTYGAAAADGTFSAALAELPALVITGPDVIENRTLSRNVGNELQDAQGRLVQYAPPYTVDLAFIVTGASERTVELLNLLNSTLTFINTVGEITMLREPLFPELGSTSWTIEIAGDTRTQFGHEDGIKSFTLGVKVVGFDIAPSYPNRLVPLAQAARIRVIPPPEDGK